MKNTCSLCNLPLNKSATIVSIDCSNSLRNRMNDMGILNGTEITPLYKSPFGDPIAFLVKNAVIALRKNDCCNIICVPN